ITIGVAIGSPSQVQHFQSLPTGLRKPGTHDIFSPAKSTGSSNEPREPRHNMNDASRPKISGWRSLGRVFGKRDRNAAQQSEHQSLREPDSRADDLTTCSPVNGSPAQFDQVRDTPKKCKQSTKQRRDIEYP